jgi:hypothetical protein
MPAVLPRLADKASSRHPVVYLNDCRRNRRATPCVQPGMDDNERFQVSAVVFYLNPCFRSADFARGADTGGGCV